MNKLIIKGIEFIAYCGVTEEERRLGQRLSADIEVNIDISKTADTDRLGDTVNYVEICHKVLSIGKTSQYHLIETLANKMAEEILTDNRVHNVVVSVKKCLPPVEAIKGYFAVEVQKSRLK